MKAKKNSSNVKEKEEKKEKSQYKRLSRCEKGRIISGVACGLGKYFNIDPSIFRIIFILLTIFSGSGIIIYLILWLVLPSESQSEFYSEKTIHENVNEMKTTAQKFADSMRSDSRTDNPRQWLGIIIIIFGLIFLFSNFGLYIFDIVQLWPLILILIGFYILSKR